MTDTELKKLNNGEEDAVLDQYDEDNQQDEETGFRHAVLRLLNCPECHQTVTDPKTLNCAHFYCAECIDLLTNEDGEVKCDVCDECTPVPEAGMKTHFLAARLLELIKAYTPNKDEKLDEDEDIDNLPAPPEHLVNGNLDHQSDQETDNESIKEGGEELKDATAELDVNNTASAQQPPILPDIAVIKSELKEDEPTEQTNTEPVEPFEEPSTSRLPSQQPPGVPDAAVFEDELKNNVQAETYTGPVKLLEESKQTEPEEHTNEPTQTEPAADQPIDTTQEDQPAIVEVPPGVVVVPHPPKATEEPAEVKVVEPPPKANKTEMIEAAKPLEAIEASVPLLELPASEKSEDKLDSEDKTELVIQPEKESNVTAEVLPKEEEKVTNGHVVEVEIHSDADSAPPSPKKRDTHDVPPTSTSVHVEVIKIEEIKLEDEKPAEEDKKEDKPAEKEDKPVEKTNGEKGESMDEPDRVMKPSEMKPSEVKVLIDDQRQCNNCHSKDCNCNENNILTPPVSMGSSLSVDQTSSYPPSEFDDTEIPITQVSRWTVEDSASNIEVANKNRIHVTRWTYDDRGAIATFDGNGSKSKLIHGHHNYSGIAISKLGFIFVINTSKGKLEEYSSETGKKIRAAKLDICRDPHAVDVTAAGEIVLVDQEANSVHVYPNIKCKESRIIRHELLKEPNDVVCTDDGFYVSCGKTRCILKFNYSGEKIWAYNENPEGRSKLKHPKGMCVDEKGSLYVVDSANKSVLVFNKNGELKGRLCDKEHETSRKPWYISVRDGTIGILYEHNLVKTYKLA